MRKSISILLSILVAFTCHASFESDNAAWSGTMIAVVGDSIDEGYPTFTSAVDIANTGAPATTDPTHWIGYQMQLVNPALTVYNASIQGRKWSDCYFVMVPWLSAHSINPRYVFCSCGINDIEAGFAFEDQQFYMLDCNEMVKAMGGTMVLGEVMPVSNGSDPLAVSIRTWNTKLQAFCAAHMIPFIPEHDFMGVTRVSTGFKDDLNPTYSLDGIHQTSAGVAAWAGFVYSWFDTYLKHASAH